MLRCCVLYLSYLLAKDTRITITVRIRTSKFSWISNMFEKDEIKAIIYFEKGAKLGQVKARHMLGIECRKERVEPCA